MLSAHRVPCDEAVIRTGRAAGGLAEAARRRALVATILGSSMAFIDGSVVNVALPSIQRELAAGVASMQWVVNAYLLFLGALVLVGGSLGDRFGRRTIFIGGIVVFTLASVACGLAPGAAPLIAARGAQGIGAALLVPSSLAIIGSVFDKAERGRAIGTWAGFGALTTALGPVLGGWLVDAISWRAIFFINVPLAVATVWLALGSVPDTRSLDAPRRLDWPGALLAILGLAGITYGLIAASARGLTDPLVLAALVGGAALFSGFVVVEARSRGPMMPLAVFRSRDFVGANLVTLLLYFALGGVLFFLPYALIRAHGYTSAEAGAALLPFSVIMGSLSRVAGRLGDRFGPRLLLSAGPAIAAAGFALIALMSPSSSYWTAILPGMAMLGLGMTISIAPLTTVVMGAVAGDHAGVASGINNAVARIAGLLAIAVLGLVFLWSFQATLHARLDHLQLPPELRHELDASPSALMAAATRPDPAAADASGAAIGAASRASLIAAFRLVGLASAGCALAAAACAALLIGRGTRVAAMGSAAEPPARARSSEPA